MGVVCKKCQAKLENAKCTECGYINEEKENNIKVKKRSRYQKKKEKNLKITSCKSCKKKISPHTIKCPYCGSIKIKKLFWRIIKIIIFISLFLLLISMAIEKLTVKIVYTDEIKSDTKIIEEINKTTPKLELIKANFDINSKISWQTIKERKMEEEKRKTSILKEKQKKVDSKLDLQMEQSMLDVD